MSDVPERLCPQTAPYVVELEPGEYWWCQCGRSESQPYCDGSHKGTGFAPVKVSLEAPRRVAWCGCKKSATEPFCDGAHKALRRQG